MNEFLKELKEMNEKINLICKKCKTVHVIYKDEGVPDNVLLIYCNFCPECEHLATEDYNETFYYKKTERKKECKSQQKITFKERSEE